MSEERQLRLMIVDDEAPARQRLRDLLTDCAQEVPHVVVGEAASGHAALELLGGTETDVVLLDIRMPEMDGIEVAQHLQLLERPPAVVFATAYDDYAIRAFEVADSQEYPEQDPTFAKHATELRTRRYGLKLVFSKELIEQSAWDVLALYIEAAGAAMKRLKEEKIFAEYENRAVTIFDNESADVEDHTTGCGTDGQTANGTFDHMDLLDMMAALGTNQYVPTDLILHPMCWSIWAKISRPSSLSHSGTHWSGPLV